MTEERLARYRDEYAGSVMGAAALAAVAQSEACEAVDRLAEKAPHVIRHEIRQVINRLTGTDRVRGEIAKTRAAIGEALHGRGGMAWADDFGIAVGQEIGRDLLLLRMAIANTLGRYPRVPDINACASLLVAQSLAHEQALYVERRARVFRDFSITLTKGGARRNVGRLLLTMSCVGLEKGLARLARLLLDTALPDGIDLANVPTIRTGCRAVLNRLADTRLWERARDKADRLNPLQISNEQ